MKVRIGGARPFSRLTSSATAIVALCAGYQPLLAQTAADPDPSVEDGAIVVSAARLPQPIDQLGTSLTVFSADMIEERQLQTVDEVLQRVPGVAIVRSGGVGQNTQVRMRGFTTKHVLTMVDGIKLNNPSEADNQYGLEHLFLNGVERVEVLRGPQSGLYGGDASAGVINIITRRPQGDPSLRVSGMYGSHDTIEGSIASMGRVGGVGYSIGANYYDTDGISIASRGPGNVERDGYRNLTLSGRGDVDVTDTLRLDGWIRYTDSRNETDSGFLPADNPQGLPGFLFQDSPGHVDTKQLFGAAKAQLETLGGRLLHNAQISYVDVSSTSISPGVEQDSEGVTVEASYYASYDIGSGGYLLAGIEHKDESGRFEQPSGGGFALIDDSINETGVFGGVNIALLQGLYISGAVRYDDNSLFGGNTTWRLSGAYNLPASLIPGVETKLRASYGTGGEAPGLRQLLGSSPTFQGNPNLTPESSWMWDVGVDQSLVDGLINWSLTWYRGKATDGIFNVTDPATGISSPQNVDSPVLMKGLEMEVQLQPATWIDLGVNFTASSATMLESGTQLFGRPKREGSAYVTVRPVERLGVTVDGYWRGKFFSDYPTNYEMPGYEIVNISATFDLTENVQLSGRIHNLFDKTYEEKLGDSTYGRIAQLRVTTTF